MDERYLRVSRGELVADAVRAAGFALDFDCGGRGKCGKCRVEVVDESGRRRTVAACQERAKDALFVDLSKLTLERSKIYAPEEDSNDVGHETSIEERKGEFGLAVDLGTTTVVCSLVSLASGRSFDRLSSRNPQLEFGRDVLSRIVAARDASRAETMRLSVAQTIASSALELTRRVGVDPSRIAEIVVAGNTTMERLFAGLDVQALGVAPFTLDSKSFREYGAEEWPAFERIGRPKVKFAPVVSAFIGGDALVGVARLRRLNAFGNERNELLLDLGTNGETIVATKGRLYASSSAAGPAFEGSEISQGSLATPGAICSIQYDVDANFWNARTIGDLPALGVCGSGLIDGLAAALDSLVLAPTGRFLSVADAKKKCLAFADRVREEGRERSFILSNELTDTAFVKLTQRDVRQAQLALGATKACARLLLKSAGLEESSLDVVYLAGGFGSTLDRQNARRVGITPYGARNAALVYCGNTSLLGAEDALTQRVAWSALEETAASVECVELASRPDFTDAFADALRFPDRKE